jgi:hypothetical protein
VKREYTILNGIVYGLLVLLALGIGVGTTALVWAIMATL